MSFLYSLFTEVKESILTDLRWVGLVANQPHPSNEVPAAAPAPLAPVGATRLSRDEILSILMPRGQHNIPAASAAPVVATRRTCISTISRCEDCAICQETNANAASRINACGHTFHTACINLWLDRSSTCPMCRAAVA